MHWIGANFCVFMFLDSRDKSLNILKSCRKNKKMKEQEKNKRSVLNADSAHNSQNAQFGLVMKKKYKFISWKMLLLELPYMKKKLIRDLSVIYNFFYITFDCSW